MSFIGLAFSALVALQGDGSQETTFHRIYLRNGNFVDGKLVSDKPNEVTVLLKAGEMLIRRDQIERVELMKMKSYNDKPVVLVAPKKTPTAEVNTAAPTVMAPEAIKRTIDVMVLKFKNSGATEKEFNLQELRSTGEDGASYLLSKAPDGDLTLQNAIMAALINLGKPGPKLIARLEEYLGSEKASIRGLALTLLTVGAGADERSRYLRPALKDSDAGVRIIAISSLGDTEDKDWFSDVADLFVDPNKDVRQRALVVCKRLAANNGLNAKLLAAATANVRHSDPAIRGEMARVIGSLGLRESWSQLSPMLLDSEPSVRAAAAQALTALAAPESGPEIVSAISRESDRGTRVSLAGAAQKLRLMDAVEPLISWLQDPDKDVQDAVIGALTVLTGETFGADQAKWAAWLKSRPK